MIVGSRIIEKYISRLEIEAKTENIGTDDSLILAKVLCVRNRWKGLLLSLMTFDLREELHMHTLLDFDLQSLPPADIVLSQVLVPMVSTGCCK